MADSKRKTYSFNRDDSITVETDVAELNLVRCFAQDSDSEVKVDIGYRYIPKNAKRPFYSDNAATGRPITQNLADRIIGGTANGTNFVDALTEEGKRGKPGTVPMWRSVAEDTELGIRSVTTVRARTRSIGGELTILPGEFVLNSWIVPMGEHVSAGRTAAEATDSADEL